jgi:DNA-binding HxlR family transcriptional regulator
MPRTSYSDWPCALARAMELFGDAWTPLIMRDAFHGLRRFEAFQQSLGIARNTLADRLRLLVDAGLLDRQMYQEYPPRAEYVLTEMGRDFFPVLAAMLTWGNKWLIDEAGAPVVLHHEPCGHESAAAVVCAECSRPLALGQVSFHVGPGYPDDLPPHLDNRARYQPAKPASASGG